MAEERFQRKVAAIIVVNVVGYSRLKVEDVRSGISRFIDEHLCRDDD
jgi:hypothetical protein